MAALSNYLENKIIDALLRGQAFSFPTSVYVGLFTVAPSDAGGGTEVSGGGYARKIATADGAAGPMDLTDWKSTQNDNLASTGTTGQSTNSGAITFPAPSGANWGSIVAFGVFDAPTGGNLLFYGNLGTPKTVNDGDAAPSFAAGALTFQIDN